jgi:hypothetical protein
MGMQASLEQISSERLSEFIQHPQLAYKYILASIKQHGDEMLGQIMDISRLDPEEFLRSSLEGIDEYPDASAEQKAQVREQLKERLEQTLSRLAAAQGRPKPGPQLVKGNKKTLPEEPRRIFPLEKDWHILHYILNGTAEGGTGPLADVVLGGTEIPDQEGIMGYGPARYLTPQQVKAVAQALAAVDFAKLVKAFDPKDAAAKRIYGLAPYPGRPVIISLEDVAGFVKPVRAFYAEASQDGNAMLLYIT